MIDALSTDRFCAIVASYGADPDRWPADERAGAVKCLAESDAARAAWREAAVLDGDLDSLPGIDVSAATVSDVTAIGVTPERANVGFMATVARHTLPYAAAAAIALVVGLAVPSPFRDAPAAPQLVAAADSETGLFADSDTELTALALVDAPAFDDGDSEAGTTEDGEFILSGLPLL